MKIKLPESDYPLLIRTDFSNDNAWELLKQKVSAPENQYEAVITFIDEKRFENLLIEQLPGFESEQEEHDFIFFADSTSMDVNENLILCIDLADEYGKHFRLTPSQLCSVSNNLFISNADFNDYANSVDSDGIFRGY